MRAFVEGFLFEDESPQKVAWMNPMELYTFLLERKAILPTDSPKKQEEETREAYRCRRKLISTLMKLRLKGQTIYNDRKPYVKSEMGVFEHKLEKEQKRHERYTRKEKERGSGEASSRT